MKNLRVLLVEDDLALRDALSDILQDRKMNVHVCKNGMEAVQILDSESFDIVVSDINMPEMDGFTLLNHIRNTQAMLPVIMMTAYGRIDQAVDVMKLGAKDYLSKPFTPDRLVEIIFKHAGGAYFDDQTVVAHDPSSIEVFKLAERVAKSDSSVMILGESGTGKEVIAQFIHRKSKRASKPFIAVNCAAIPENMLESILFGYEKGAFTGAIQAQPGKFEQANGGTLLLDEITEMDIALQAKLLRVLQEKKVERLGGKKIIDLDVRVLATSNRDLAGAVSEGFIREDLYYRLAVFPIQWMPLRDRPGDIIPLANHFLKLHCNKTNLPELILSEKAEITLSKHNWPGNVRELDNVIQRAMILAEGMVIQENDIMIDTISDESKFKLIEKNQDRENIADLSQTIKSAEHEKILKTLKVNDGSRNKTAKDLGISARTLRYKLSQMRDSGINVDVDKVV